MHDVRNGAPRTWFEIADDLRAAQGMSQDDLAYEARRFGAPATLTGSWLSAMKKGKRPLTLDVLKGIAGALDEKPEIFVEFRLAKIRALFDERQVGLEAAAENLSVLGEIVEEVGVPGPTGELLQRMTDALPSERDRGQAESAEAGKRHRVA